MKTVYLNVQAKGGAGKSMLTYLQALKLEMSNNTAFVDLDSSTKTTSKQLKFIRMKTPNRLVEVDIFDDLKKIEREKLITVFEALRATNFEQIFIDFGAAESEQFPKLFNIDFTLDEFKGFETELDMQFVFNVVLAGGTSYQGSFAYLKRITESLKGKFELNVYVNEFTFRNYAPLINEVRAFAKSSRGIIKGVVPFGDIHADRGSGQLIIENIKEGRGMADYNSFTSRTIIKREIAKI